MTLPQLLFLFSCCSACCSCFCCCCCLCCCCCSSYCCCCLHCLCCCCCCSACSAVKQLPSLRRVNGNDSSAQKRRQNTNRTRSRSCRGSCYAPLLLFPSLSLSPHLPLSPLSLPSLCSCSPFFIVVRGSSEFPVNFSMISLYVNIHKSVKIAEFPLPLCLSLSLASPLGLYLCSAHSSSPAPSSLPSLCSHSLAYRAVPFYGHF